MSAQTENSSRKERLVVGKGECGVYRREDKKISLNFIRSGEE